METISVNKYITDNFTKRMQQKIRLAIKGTFKDAKGLTDSYGNAITGYRNIFLSQVPPNMARSTFLMGQFSFRSTGDGKFWLKYVKGLKKQEDRKWKLIK